MTELRMADTGIPTSRNVKQHTRGQKNRGFADAMRFAYCPGFAAAQSVSGGIPTGEVSADTCESKKMQGLYLTGEILDIDGECGGWNLQFAWSTGYLAGKHAAEAL